jgi:hypothetical protein
MLNSPERDDPLLRSPPGDKSVSNIVLAPIKPALKDFPGRLIKVLEAHSAEEIT